jgi:hypothetical protein
MSAYIDTPAPHGATKMPSRAESEGKGKTYVHRAFPSVRYHPDGSLVIVDSAEASKALGDPWRADPYPPVPVVVPPPELTVAELKDALTEARKQLSDRTLGVAERDKSIADKDNLIAEQALHLAELRSKRRKE